VRRRALLFASGQAAAAAVFQVLAPGDPCSCRATCTGAAQVVPEFAESWRLGVELYDNASLDDLAAKARVRGARVHLDRDAGQSDLGRDRHRGASTIARETGALVAVDSTAATPVLTRPLELGRTS
jgi:cystathionine gamma-synthase